MELGLSLGDASRSVGLLKESKSAVQDPKPTKMTTGLNFCMALGLNSSPAPPADKDPDDDDDDDDDDISHNGDDESDDHHHHHPKKNPMLQLNLLPLVPVNPRRRQIASHHLPSLPWSSDNGSSENGSSGNVAAARRVEEVSSANSFNLELMGGAGGNKKRSSEDEDENALNAAAARKKLRLSKQQSAFLEESFKEHHTLNPKQKQALAKELSLRPRQVEVWFQNRRARTKLKQTEVDCEYLKRCCDTLTEENRRLNKELQELRSLNKNTANPFYIQPPATTLTMCPSCERVVTATAARPTFYPAPTTNLN